MTPKPPHVRLAFGRLFWRLYVLWVVMGLLWVWRIVELRVPPGRRTTAMFLIAPRVLYISLVLSTVLTVLVDLIVRFVVRPMVVRWHRPVSEPHGALFQIEANERIAMSVPARFRSGRRWQVGSLVLTDRAIRFFPDAWDVEPWTYRRAEVRALHVEAPPSYLLGLIRGLPERLVVELVSGEILTLIVAEPDEVVGWLPADSVSRAAWPPQGQAAELPPPSLERTA